MSYDSKVDTLLHIKRVAQLLTEAASELIKRANVHDDSKLKSPEKEMFDEATTRLKVALTAAMNTKDSLKN